MKTITLSLLLTIACYGITGQTYHPLVAEGKIWSTYHNPCKSPSGNQYSDYLKFEGDKNINDTIYKKMWTCRDTTNNSWVQWGFIREDGNQRVWTRNGENTTERLTYDFSVTEGDSIPLFQDPSYFYHVDSIDMVQLLNGEYRRRFHISFDEFYTETWIEEIGSMKGVYYGLAFGIVGDNPELICFLDGSEVLWHNQDYTQCHYITGINEKQTNGENILIRPNPANGSVTVTINGFAAKNLRILDIHQREIMSVPAVKDKPVQIDISGLAPGLYLIEAEGRLERMVVR